MRIIDVVIVNYHQAPTLIPLVKELIKEDVVGHVIVVDNSQDKKEKEILVSDLKDKRISLVVNQKNLGFARGCNLGFKQVKSDYVAFINPDIVYKVGTLDKILDLVNKTQADISAPVIVNKSGKLIPTAGFFPKWSLKFWRKVFLWPEKIDYLISRPKKVDWSTGAFMVVKSGVFKNLGGFDENFKLYYEDLDLCLRAKRGSFNIWYLPVKATHLAHRSVVKNKQAADKWYKQSRFYFIKKHKGLFLAWLDQKIKTS